MVTPQATMMVGQILQPINVLTQQERFAEAERELDRIMEDFAEQLGTITALTDSEPLSGLKLLDIGYRMVGVLYNNLGNCYYDQYEQRTSKALLNDSARCHKKAQENGNIAPGAPYGDSNHIFVTALFGMGRAAWAQGQQNEARKHLLECLAIELAQGSMLTPNQQMAFTIKQQARELLQKVDAPTPVPTRSAPPPARATPVAAPARPAQQPKPSSPQPAPAGPAPTRKRADIGTFISLLVIALVVVLILNGLGVLNLGQWLPAL